MLVWPAPVCLAADTSPLDGFQALFCFLSWFPSDGQPGIYQLVCRLVPTNALVSIKWSGSRIVGDSKVTSIDF